LMALLLLVGARSAGADERLLGYAVRPDGWVLQTAQPAFTLTESWQTVLPELAAEPSSESWQQAWRGRGQPRGRAHGEGEGCAAERQGPLLKVQAPGKLFERLKAAKSDAVKGEAWLLAGTGLIRPAALVELIEAGE